MCGGGKKKKAWNRCNSILLLSPALIAPTTRMPATSCSDYRQRVWELVEENKPLNLHTGKVLRVLILVSFLAEVTGIRKQKKRLRLSHLEGLKIAFLAILLGECAWRYAKLDFGNFIQCCMQFGEQNCLILVIFDNPKKILSFFNSQYFPQR